MRLKILASIILVLVLGYTVFWHYMAGEVEDRIEQWVTDQKQNGLSVRYDDLSITGFPYRMELALRSLQVSKTGGHTAPFLVKSPTVTLVAFPWKINHGVIISEGGDVRIGTRSHPKISLSFGKTRSSVMVDMASRKFERASFVISDLVWNWGGPVMTQNMSTAREVKLHFLRPLSMTEGSEMELPLQLKIYLEGADVMAQEIPVGIFGKKADQIKIDVQIHGDHFPVYSQEGLSAWRDKGGTLAVNNIEVMSGQMDMELQGEVTLDQDLKPLGAFSSTIHGVDHIVKILSGHSAFQKEPGNVILEELTRMSKVEKSGAHQGMQAMELAISLQGGLVFLGPIPVYELTPVVK